MTEEIKKLLEEALEEVTDLVDYVHSESGDPTLHQWVISIEDKLSNLHKKFLNFVSFVSLQMNNFMI